MRTRLAFEYSYAREFLSDEEWEASLERVNQAHETLMTRSGAGNEFLGWFDLPESMLEQMPAILDAAKKIQQQSNTLVVVGIGGSYLGARAVIEACAVPFQRPAVDIVYAGNNIDGRYFSKLLDYVEESNFSVNVISKSGTTTEPAIAFRILRDVLNEQFGTLAARERIYATTDSSKGALHDLAFQEDFSMFSIPDNVGGRFSVFTPVGLLPIAAAGINIEGLLAGAISMKERIMQPDATENPAFAYAALRDAFYRKGKKIEVLAGFQSGLQYISEWWKQLFGESEGKDGKGLFPAAVIDTTDLHSMGQYIQEGERNIFETFVTVDETQLDVMIEEAENNADGLNYLAGKTLADVNTSAYEATALAHKDGGVPNSRIIMPSLSPFAVGELLYFFEYAVAVSGYALGVNPFDQPGVEAYKKNMFALLNKPGFEDQSAELQKRLDSIMPLIVE
jgi:glucose-6-phosphate isomerase